MFAYLDNSATTRPCARAMQRMNESMDGCYFNPSSLYAPAAEAERRMDECRRLLLSQLGGRDHQMIFTSGGTEANNLAILGSIAAMRGQRHIISAGGEHPSVLAALDHLKAVGHRITLLPSDTAGAPDMDALRQALGDGAALVSLMHVNNETGAVTDIAAVSKMVRSIAPDALIHVDGVQGFLRVALDLRLADLHTLSAHKIGGPKGVGALAVRRGVRLLPRQLGGGQEGALRSGTENTPGIAGLMGAAEHMITLTDLESGLRQKKLRLHRAILQKMPDAIANGPSPEEGAPHILNLSFPGIRAEVLLHALEADGVLCSTGAACSSKKRKASSVLSWMGLSPARTESALRFSLCPDTTDDEIDYAAERIGIQYARLKPFKRR